MLNIARKITEGSYCGLAFGREGKGRRIPCSWDSSGDEDEGGLWEEDDFGVSLGSVGGERTGRAKEVGGSWEID